MTDAALVARYPFLPGSSDLLGDLRPSLQDLVSDPGYEPVRHLAREEVIAALGAKRGPEGSAPSTFDAAKPEERILSFLYSRMLVAVAPSSQRVARRWCEGVASSAASQLGRPGAPPEEWTGLASSLDLEVIPAEGSSGHLSFALPSYCRLSSSLREDRFRLARQDLRRGWVDVAPALGVELLEEGVRAYLSDEVALLRLDPELQSGIKEREAELLSRVSALAPAYTPGGFGQVLRPDLFPPCMKQIRSSLDHGQNVPHAGRFALASFMNKVGVEVDAIVDAYRGAPNFKEGLTRYQVTQIAHHDGGEGYTPPDCATMAANGICAKQLDEARPQLCADPGRVRNPLNYYRTRTRSSVRSSSSSTPPPTSDAGAPKTGDASEAPKVGAGAGTGEPNAAPATSTGPASTPSPDPARRTPAGAHRTA